jgi:tRNA pseudouridine38-40 synthase
MDQHVELMSSFAEKRTIKLVISYDGFGFCGWQRQNNGQTIQGEIEAVLHHLTGEHTVVNGAGRTDAGVHADGMVAHFSTHSRLSPAVFQRGLNALLPASIRIYQAEEVPLSFHARFSAIGKKYRYSIYTGAVVPPMLRFYVWHVPRVLDLDSIDTCLAIVTGTHDFSSFENSGTRDKSVPSVRGAVRTIYQATLDLDQDGILALQFFGNGFLRNMVRNLVGTLVEVGLGKIPNSDFVAILQAKDRTKGGPTAPAHGLCLQEVLY